MRKPVCVLAAVLWLGAAVAQDGMIAPAAFLGSLVP